MTRDAKGLRVNFAVGDDGHTYRGHRAQRVHAPFRAAAAGTRRHACPTLRISRAVPAIEHRQRQSTRGSFDHALRPAFDSRVAVHEYNGTASAKTDNPLVVTGLRQLLTAGIPTTTQV